LCDVVQSAHHHPIHNYTLARFEDIQNMKVEDLKPSHIVAIVVILLGGASNLLNFGNFFLLKKKRICNRIFLFKEGHFSKNGGENWPQKNSKWKEG
jgi:hypothetical protein